MPHTIEAAASGRARCRACSKKIDKGVLRFGERMPSPYGEGEMTLWFHVICGALARPDPFLEAVAESSEPLERAGWLEAEAKRGIAHRRLPRINGVQRAPTGRARCRSCREMIDKDAWRISLLYYEEGRFEPSGSIHVACAQAYFDTTEVMERLRHYTPDLADGDIKELQQELDSGKGSPKA